MRSENSAYSGPSCATSSGSGSSGSVGSGRAPQQTAHRRAKRRAHDRQSLQPALRRLLVVEPGGRPVAVELDNRLVAEGAGRAQRIRRIRHEAARAVERLELEQVLHPGERGRRQAKLPAGAPAPERRRLTLRPVGDEPDSCELPPGVRHPETKLAHESRSRTYDRSSCIGAYPRRVLTASMAAFVESFDVTTDSIPLAAAHPSWLSFASRAKPRPR
jgi:hypothetical protein